jgi:hypothetical protein
MAREDCVRRKEPKQASEEDSGSSRKALSDTSLSVDADGSLLDALNIILSAPETLRPERRHWMLAAVGSESLIKGRGLTRWHKNVNCPVSRRTLARDLYNLKRGQIASGKAGHKPTLNSDQELEVLRRVQALEADGAAPVTKTIGNIAKEIAAKPLFDGEAPELVASRVARCGGKDWVVSWAKRHNVQYAKGVCK